ncbi:MAG: FAD:protein FMN transferase [Gemmatimonadota bacterium]|nr:FAD:protein FMN transferase [Gemmatimonadota bacterium]
MSEPRELTRRDVLRITAVGGAALALGGGLTLEILRRAGLRRVTETRPRLGTLVTITAVHEDGGHARAIVRSGFAEIERLEGILSRHAANTPMSALNRDGMLAPVPDELRAVLRRARTMHDWSGGAFDPTVAPLLRAYERRHERDGSLPTREEIERALRAVGFDGVDVRDGQVRFTRPGMALTLDGIAKGFVVDRAVAEIAATGAERIMVDAGGDIASGGTAVRDDPWTIAVEDPDEPARSLAQLRLRGQAVATSGDYMQAFTQDRRHHHILDPRTGRSPEHTSSVTVVTDTAMDADALSTALLVLGPEAGLAMLERVPGAEGLIVAKDGERFASEGWA